LDSAERLVLYYGTNRRLMFEIARTEGFPSLSRHNAFALSEHQPLDISTLPSQNMFNTSHLQCPAMSQRTLYQCSSVFSGLYSYSLAFALPAQYLLYVEIVVRAKYQACGRILLSKHIDDVIQFINFRACWALFITFLELSVTILTSSSKSSTRAITDPQSLIFCRPSRRWSSVSNSRRVAWCNYNSYRNHDTNTGTPNNINDCFHGYRTRRY
jgi:hypothetical protein